MKLGAKIWPVAILFSILACVAACVATIIISLDYPVHLDDAYLSNHKVVDSNINEILANQKDFQAKYSFKFISDDKASITMSDSSAISDALKPKCVGLLTRPETNEFNHDLPCEIEQGVLSLKLPQRYERPGRWQILVRVNIADLSGFFKREFFVK